MFAFGEVKGNFSLRRKEFLLKISEQSEEIHLTFYLFPLTFSLFSRQRRENTIRRLIIEPEVDHFTELISRICGTEADAQTTLVDVSDGALGKLGGVGNLERKARVAEVTELVEMLLLREDMMYENFLR